MAENPWYPFYVGDYQQKTSHLSLAHHGAYRLLIDHYMATRHFLPLDHVILYRICRIYERKERKIIDEIMQEFFHKTEHGYDHKKCDEILVKQLNYSKSQSANAKIRHQKTGVKNMPTTMPTTMPARARLPQPQSDKKEKENDVVVKEKIKDEKKPSTYHGTEFHPRFNEVREYVIARLPALNRQNATEVNRWLLDGADPDTEIYPAVIGAIEYKQGNIGSFSYFTASINSMISIRKDKQEQHERMMKKYAKPE